MPLSVKTFLAQIMKLSPLLKSCSLETIRKGQDMIGELIEAKNKNNVIIKKHTFSDFYGAWLIPKD